MARPARPPKGASFKPSVENPGKVMNRILSYVTKYYGVHMVLVVICTFINVFATLQGTLFTKTLIDGYLTPFVKNGVEFSFNDLFMDMVPVIVLFVFGEASYKVFRQQYSWRYHVHIYE